MKQTSFFILFLSVILLTACASPATQVESTIKSSALFQIIKSDGATFDVTLDAVKALPLAQLTVDGKAQEGPKLKDILALAGVTEFISVDIEGSSSPAILTFEQVDDNTIFDFNNHGTMKLATTYVPFANWTKDISKITVK